MNCDDELSIVKHAAAENGFLFIEVDGRGLKTENDIMTAFETQLEFPEYCGHNWNAFYDCLSDFYRFPEPERGYILLFDHYKDFYDHAPDESSILHEILWDMVHRVWVLGKWVYVFLGDTKR
jgi:hypothetical protein